MFSAVRHLHTGRSLDKKLQRVQGSEFLTSIKICRTEFSYYGRGYNYVGKFHGAPSNVQVAYTTISVHTAS